MRVGLPGGGHLPRGRPANEMVSLRRLERRVHPSPGHPRGCVAGLCERRPSPGQEPAPASAGVPSWNRHISSPTEGHEMSERWMPSVADRYDDEKVRSFYDSGVWRPEVHSDLLDAWCLRQPQKVAVSDGTSELTYAELRGQSYRLGAALRRMGVEAGDRVVVQLPNWCEFAVTYAALARIGAVMVALMTVYRHDEIAYIAELTAAKGIVTTGLFRNFDHLGMVRNILPQCPSLELVIVARTVPGEPGPLPSPDDGHVCIFTSGTEARPKGCYHTFNTYRASLQHLVNALGATEQDAVFMPSP